MHIAVKGSRTSSEEHADKLARAVHRRADNKQLALERRAEQEAKTEMRRYKDFADGDGKHKSVCQVSVAHDHVLARRYGDGWRTNHEAIRHAAKSDPVIAAQCRTLLYAADAVRANS